MDQPRLISSKESYINTMKQSRVLFVIALLLVIVPVNSQSLKIGEPFPYKHLLPADVRIPVILDLFSSGCLACFSAMPKLKALQQQFEGRMQFRLVGQLDEQVAQTYARFEKRYGLRFPVAFDPAPLHSMNFSSFPQYIWVDRSRIVRAITGPERIDAVSIQQFLDSGILHQPVMPIYDRNGLFLVNGNGGNDTNFLVRSLLTRWQPPLPRYRISSPRKDRPVFQAIGVDLEELYSYAVLGLRYMLQLDSLYGLVSRRVVFDGIDSSIWSNTLYCYSSLLPGSQVEDAEFEEVLRQDLARAFGASASLEWRSMPYWRLVVIADTNRLSTRHDTSYLKTSHGSIAARRIPMRRLVSILRRDNPLEPPIMDETGIRGFIDIELECILSDMAELRQALRHAGLDLVPGLRMMHTIVVRKRQKGLQR